MGAHLRIAGLLPFMLTILGSAATSAEICGRSADSLDNLLAEIRRDASLKPIVAGDQYLAFQTAQANTTLWTWAFTKAGHPAHPAVVCRKLSQAKKGNWYATMRIRCGASKPSCDRLAVDFTELNEQMRKSMEKR